MCTLAAKFRMLARTSPLPADDLGTARTCHLRGEKKVWGSMHSRCVIADHGDVCVARSGFRFRRALHLHAAPARPPVDADSAPAPGRRTQPHMRLVRVHTQRKGCAAEGGRMQVGAPAPHGARLRAGTGLFFLKKKIIFF